MPVIDANTCIACGDCHRACPAEAIVPGDRYRIDSESCTDCHGCVEVCPTASIVVPRAARLPESDRL